MQNKIFAASLAACIAFAPFALAQSSDSVNDTNTSPQTASQASAKALPSASADGKAAGTTAVKSNSGKTLPAHPPTTPASKTD